MYRGAVAKHARWQITPTGTSARRTRRKSISVRAHLRKLLAEGYTKRGICRDYGIPRPTIHNLMTAHHRTGKPVKRIKTETARRILEIGSHVSFVYYRDDQPVKVFDSLEDFCNETGRTMKNARWLCTPSAQKKRTYLVRVNY